MIARRVTGSVDELRMVVSSAVEKDPIDGSQAFLRGQCGFEIAQGPRVFPNGGSSRWLRFGGISILEYAESEIFMGHRSG
jgi:hypothetical protein